MHVSKPIVAAPLHHRLQCYLLLFLCWVGRVVALEEIKQHFPQGTTFEDYWPAKGSIEPVHAQRVPAGNWTQKPATSSIAPAPTAVTAALPQAKPAALPQSMAQSYSSLAAAAASSRSNAAAVAAAAALSPYDVNAFQQILRLAARIYLTTENEFRVSKMCR